MVVVKRCVTLEEAHLARTRLADAGIEADVLDEATAATAPYLLNSSGIRLAVSNDDADQAADLLGVPRNTPVAVPRRGGLPVWIAVIVGVAAITILISGVKQSRGSSATGSKQDEDRNADGQTDSRWVYDAKGRATESFEDNNFDGKWDVRFVRKQGGVVATSEQDLDFDGAFDSYRTYAGGVIVDVTVIPGGVGNPLFRDEFERGVRVARWSDPERDGKWNERIEFDAMGRETARKALK